MKYRITFSEATVVHNASLPKEDVSYYTTTQPHVVKTNDKDREIEYYTNTCGLSVVKIEERINGEWQEITL